MPAIILNNNNTYNQKTSDVVLTEQEQRLLELLYDFRKMDSTSLREHIAPNLSRQDFYTFLSGMEARSLIVSKKRPGEPSIIGLTKRGADAIGKPIKCQHYQQVGLRTLQLQQLQMQLERIALQLGLIIHREIPAVPGDKETSRTNPTRQLVIEDYLFLEGQQLEKLRANGQYIDPARLRDYQAGVATVVPAAFRDYYLHLEDCTGAITILTRPSSDYRFWLGKVKMYRELVERVPTMPVICVFNKDEPPARLKAEFVRAGFHTTTLANLVTTLINALRLNPNQQYQQPQPSQLLSTVAQKGAF